MNDRDRCNDALRLARRALTRARVDDFADASADFRAATRLLDAAGHAEGCALSSYAGALAICVVPEEVHSAGPMLLEAAVRATVASRGDLWAPAHRRFATAVADEGDWSTAREALSDVLERHDRDEDARGVMEFLEQRATLANRFGHLDEGLEDLQTALTVVEFVGALGRAARLRAMLPAG